MSELLLDGKKIHYEVHGEATTNSPIVILNGIMMSTKSWHQFLPSLTQHNQVILLDFFDQGLSADHPEPYTQAKQVEVVKAVFDHLALHSPTLVGISYGGSVALTFAATYPEHIGKLMVLNATTHYGDWQRAIGESWILSKNDPANFYATTIPWVYAIDFYNANPNYFNERKELLSTNVFNQTTFMERMERLTRSVASYDVLGDLPKITAQTMIVGSEDDYLTPVKAQRRMADGIKGADLVIMADCGHASMYERPIVFTSLIQGFANYKS